MVDAHASDFAAFKSVHDMFVLDRKTWQNQFHDLGKKILEIIRDYESRLCASMERGNFAAYSNKVSEKFWSEIKKDYSHIELIGVKSSFDN